MNNYGKEEENISTEQSPQSEKARVSSENEYESRTRDFKTTTRQGTQEINTVSLLRFRLPKDSRLRKPKEFQRVYSKGKRLSGEFMTVFFMPSDTQFQRLGITASKKAIGNAVMRNRSKRLLREAFRLSKLELDELETKYDWVINARRNLLQVKLEKPLAEFRRIVGKIKVLENKKGEKSV